MPATCRDAAGEIVVAIAGFWSGVLEDTGDKPHFLGSLRGQERRRRAAEVVQRHRLTVLLLGAPAYGERDAAIVERAATETDPERVMVLATQEPGANLVEIAPQVGAENSGTGQLSSRFDLVSSGKSKNLDVIVADDAVDMTVNRQRRNAATSDRPEAEDGNDQAVAELNLPLLARAGGQGVGRLPSG